MEQCKHLKGTTQKNPHFVICDECGEEFFIDDWSFNQNSVEIENLKQKLNETMYQMERLLIHSIPAVERMQVHDIPYADVLNRVVKQVGEFYQREKEELK